jgi:hypothetical protein
MGDYPETNPQVVTSTVNMALAGVDSTEVIITKVPKYATVTDAWAMTDAAAAADADLTVTVYNRDTAFDGTAEIAVLGGAGTAWSATTPKVGTVANNTGITASSYISAGISRDSASTATAHIVSVGVAFVPGSPAAVGSIA